MNTIDEIVSHLWRCVIPKIEQLRLINEELEEAWDNKQKDRYHKALKELAHIGDYLLPLKPFVQKISPPLSNLFILLDDLYSDNKVVH